MIIDGHAHTFAEFSKTETLIPLMDSLGVDKVVLCPGGAEPNTEFKIPKVKDSSKLVKVGFFHFFGNIFYLRPHSKKFPEPNNDFVFSLVQEAPDRLLQFFWADPNDLNLEQKLRENYDIMTYAGIKLHQCLNKFSNLDEGMEIISRFANEKKLPIFIHLYNFKEARRFVKLARKYPKTNYIIAHLMGFETIVRKGRELKNIYFDISPYYIISEKRIFKVIEVFGEDRVLLGTDSPLGHKNLESNIKKINNMNLTNSQKRKILGENIAYLLDLD